MGGEARERSKDFRQGSPGFQGEKRRDKLSLSDYKGLTKEYLSPMKG